MQLISFRCSWSTYSLRSTCSQTFQMSMSNVDIRHGWLKRDLRFLVRNRMNICQVIFAKLKNGSDAHSNYFVVTFIHSSKYKSNGRWLLGQCAEKMGPYLIFFKGPRFFCWTLSITRPFLERARGPEAISLAVVPIIAASPIGPPSFGCLLNIQPVSF